MKSLKRISLVLMALIFAGTISIKQVKAEFPLTRYNIKATRMTSVTESNTTDSFFSTSNREPNFPRNNSQVVAQISGEIVPESGGIIKVVVGGVVVFATYLIDSAIDFLSSQQQTELSAMRFQVQWGTNSGGPTFAEVATAPSSTGVTVAQAITALRTTLNKVTPTNARLAASPAATRQETWIKNRPPFGISGRLSRPEYFRYRNFPDARVDVENLRGTNLKS